MLKTTLGIKHGFHFTDKSQEEKLSRSRRTAGESGPLNSQVRV